MMPRMHSDPAGNPATPLAGRPALDCSAYMPIGAAGESAAQHGLSQMALGLSGSEILKIAASVRALQAQGQTVCNLTVGDFLPREFPIPELLQAAIGRAYERRETNYPPSDGMPQTREAVVDFYQRTLGLRYPIESVVICAGARPAIYATYRALVEPGDRVIYPTPSWNNNHYIHLVGGVPVECPTRAEDGFMPTAEALAPLLPGARLLCLNSPQNPAGTVIGEAELLRICQLIVDENQRRAATGERTLYLMFDQVYFMLTFGSWRHLTPPGLLPAMAAYTIFVDAISKSLCATGLRVGWAVAPPYVTARMRDILGHVGAWAPRPEQLAAAEVLRDLPGMHAFHQQMTAKVQQRLDILYDSFTDMQRRGLPVRAIPPQGAIYLSVQFALHGLSLPSGDRRPLTTNEQIRCYLLESAGLAVVPFRAFGMLAETGWMRLSVGAVSPDEIRQMLPRLSAALTGLL
jgi:aspartate aminotransferase